MYPSRTGTGNLCLMPGAEGRVDHAQKGLNNHRLSLQEIVVTRVKGSDLWGDNRNVRHLQSDTSCLGRKKRPPSHFPQGPVLLLPALGTPGPLHPCVHHVLQSRLHRGTGMNTSKMSVWKNALTSSQKDQQNIHASVTHPASTIGHIPVKNPTTMQSWRWVIPRFALIFAVPHKDNLTILTLPQLYLL